MQGIIRLQEPMSHHTSWRLGGPADVFFMPQNMIEVREYFQTLSTETDIFWCGLGSNILVRDSGIRGVVIAPQKFMNKIECLDQTTVRAEAGAASAALARYTARAGLSGLEFLAGIPGTVGGALAMNAGCAGGETWLQVVAVEMIDRRGLVTVLPSDQFVYSYRHVEIPKDHWFVAAHFALVPHNKEACLEKIRTLLAYRTRTQPTNEQSGGSTFRNPPSDFAARLIEASGLKGYQIGGAMVSMKHANFFVNTGTSTAQDMEALIHYVQQEVLRAQGVQLVLEVQIVGEK